MSTSKNHPNFILHTYMEFNLKMVIHRTAAILNLSLVSFLYSEDCFCCITEDYFNETILSHHITILDINLAETQPILYRYGLSISGCTGDISIALSICNNEL